MLFAIGSVVSCAGWLLCDRYRLVMFAATVSAEEQALHPQWPEVV